jgi:hypothetical protein
MKRNAKAPVKKPTPRKKRTNNTRLSNDPNLISFEHFPVWRGVVLNKKLYNAWEIVKAVRNHPNTFRTVPHSRRPLTPANIQAAMAVVGRLPKNPNAMTYNAFGSRRAIKRFNKSEKYQNVPGTPQHASFKAQLTRLHAAIASAIQVYARPGTARAVGYHELVDLTDRIEAAVATANARRRTDALWRVLIYPVAFKYMPPVARGPVSTRMDKPIIQELRRLRQAIAAAIHTYSAAPFTSSADELDYSIALLRAATSPAAVERELFSKLLRRTN